ncbi:MAG: hypothetical protein IJW83_02735 [Clostridia bacterium]|nr:hypothetical protein [Clostridia bacterium]
MRQRFIAGTRHRAIGLLLVLCLCVLSLSACAPIPPEEPTVPPSTETPTEPSQEPPTEPEPEPEPEPIPLDIIMHAGGGANGRIYYNAQQLFYYYYNLGYRVFEYDCDLSADGRIICTHGWATFEVRGNTATTYKTFKKLALYDGYTPAYEEWLVETLIAYPDVTFIIDPKAYVGQSEVLVLQRWEAIEEEYGIDLSDRIIPEITGKSMWDIAKVTTDFDRYIFSLYQEEYTGEELLTYFSDERIFAFSLHVYCPGNVRSYIDQMKSAGKAILIFTPTTLEELDLAVRMGADGIYIDTPDLLPDANIVPAQNLFPTKTTDDPIGDP